LQIYTIKDNNIEELMDKIEDGKDYFIEVNDDSKLRKA